MFNSYYEKVGNNYPVLVENLPFEIPHSWAWARLGNIGDWGAGATPPRSNKKFYGGTIPWIKTGELNNDYIYSSEETVTEKALQNCSLRYNNINDILIAMYGATIGKLGIAGIRLTTNQACCACTPYNGLYNLYLYYFLMAEKNRFIKLGSGGARPNISREKIVNYLLPLPPYNEQARIVELLINIFNKINLIEQECNTLEQLMRQVKYKILDLYFSKNSRYKSYYTEKALDDVARIVFGQAPNSAAVIEKQADNSIEFHQGKSLFGEYYLEKSNRWCTEPTKITNGNSIVMSVRAPVGDVNICNRIICIGRGLCSIEPYCSIDEKYLFYLLLSKKQYLESKSTGSTFAAVNSKTVKDMKVVVCKDNIQRLIVKKIEKAFSLLDKIVSQ